MNKREFLKTSALGALGVMLAPSLLKAFPAGKRLRTAHIGVGGMGAEDLKAIPSHSSVDVVALCDVDTRNLSAAHKLHPRARVFSDYREMLKELGDEIDAVV